MRAATWRRGTVLRRIGQWPAVRVRCRPVHPRSSEPARGAGQKRWQRPRRRRQNDDKSDGKRRGVSMPTPAISCAPWTPAVHTVGRGPARAARCRHRPRPRRSVRFCPYRGRVEARLQVLNAEAAGWQNRSLPVTLRRDGVPVLDRSMSSCVPARASTASSSVYAERVGKYLYGISTPVPLGEAIAENNHRAFILGSLRDKIRCRACRRAADLGRGFCAGCSSTTPTSIRRVFILRLPSDLSAAGRRPSLIPFPCEELFQEQLRSFDLIIVANFQLHPPTAASTYNRRSCRLSTTAARWR